MPDPTQPPLQPGADLSGRELGDYRLLRRLGKGAMAEVYLAEQSSLGRQVAFKVLKSDLARDTTYVRRFEMEARAAASLVHGNIVQIYEVGHIDGIRFIAQEYVPGQNLSQLLDRSGSLDVPTAIGMMRQVAAALAKSAEQGIVHRDIKPENLMLSSAGEVKVADFGLARIAEDSEKLNLTQVGVTMGSPLYMSPEQIEGRPLEPCSDIYSFGVTCYQMLTGRPPFTGDTALNVAVQHLKTPPEPLENVRPDLPPGLCRIVHKMLSKDTHDRYADATEVLRDLRALDIPGANGEWPEEFEQFNTAESVALGSARSAATQRLSEAMSHGGGSPFWSFRRLTWLAVAIGLLLGAMLGWPRTRASMLPSQTSLPTEIEPMGSGKSQWEYAMKLETVEGWQSVIEFYPDDVEYVTLARKQLAELHLTRNELYEAREIFHAFTALGEAQPEAKAYGLAGKYIVYSLDDLSDRAQDILLDLLPMSELLDDQMGRRVADLSRQTQLTDAQQRRYLEDLRQRFPVQPNNRPSSAVRG